MGPKTVEKIETHGITSIEKLADMTPEQLTAIPGIGEKMVEKIQLSVAAYFQSLEKPAGGEAGEPLETDSRGCPPKLTNWLRAAKEFPETRGSCRNASRGNGH